MDRPDDLAARARAAAYLGLTLREARGYVLNTQAQEYGSYRLRWTVHVGVPSAGYDDRRVKSAFLRVARAAWFLSRRSGSPTLETATAALERTADGAAIEADRDVTGIEVYPEPTENTEGTKPVAHNDTVFAQVLKLVPRHEFESLARKHKSGRMSRSMTRWGQFVAMGMAQLTGRCSLRDIVSNLAAPSCKLYHLGVGVVTRSSLARVNAEKPWEMYEELRVS